MNGDIIIKDTLEQLGTEVANRYIAHVYCYAGTCEVGFNDSCFQMEAGDCMIIVSNKLVENIAPSEDFRCKVIHIKDTFLEMCTPEGNNYYVTGTMSLFLNPVMKPWISTISMPGYTVTWMCQCRAHRCCRASS